MRVLTCALCYFYVTKPTLCSVWVRSVQKISGCRMRPRDTSTHAIYPTRMGRHLVTVFEPDGKGEHPTKPSVNRFRNIDVCGGHTRNCGHVKYCRRCVVKLLFLPGTREQDVECTGLHCEKSKTSRLACSHLKRRHLHMKNTTSTVYALFVSMQYIMFSNFWKHIQSYLVLTNDFRSRTTSPRRSWVTSDE